MIQGNIDIFCISETKLDQSYPTEQFIIPGYSSPYRLDGPKIIKASGGMLVYIKEDIPSKRLKTHTLPIDIQVVPIELNFKKAKWLLIPIYRPPSKSKVEFISHLSHLIDNYVSNYDNILLLGDFNMEADENEMMSIINDHNLYSMIKQPTCFKTSTGRCIDLMLTTKKHSFQYSQTVDTGESDFHHMIYTMFKTTYTKTPPKVIKYRCYKHFSKSAFECDIIEKMKTSANPSSYSLFQNILQQTLDKHAPFKTKIARGNNKSFITKDLRKAISNRSKLKNIANFTKDSIDIQRYKKQRNFVKNLNFKTKRDYYKTLNPKKLEFSKKFWKTFKPFLSNKSESGGKMFLIENECIVSDDLEIASIMNQYFSTITNSLHIKSWPEPEISLNNEDYVTHAIRKFANHPSIQKIKSHTLSKKFNFKHITPEQVIEKVKGLDTGKSSRGDLPTKILKEEITLLYPFITDCFNASINEGSFPNEMKLSDITCIFKKDDNTNKTNYRPISILSALSKVFERLIADQLNDFMKDKLSKYLTGFRKGFSCEDSLLRLLENWRQSLDKGDIVGTILCDLSKAFDTLPHELIIAKLAAYGLDHDALNLISNYLLNRMQRCKVGSTFSSWVDILVGVPQGSVLGPLLFNIFLNDFFIFIEESKVCNFADDTTIYASGKDIYTVICKLEKDIENALNWFQQNSLVPNPEKFQIMFLGTKCKINICLDIKGKKTYSTQEVKLLGVTIDWKLLFNSHVDKICHFAKNKTGALMRLRNILTTEQKLLLYNSFIKSQFGYCSCVWMYHGKTADLRINNIQKRALRAVYNDFSSSYEQLLTRGNHDTIHQSNLKAMIVKVYKCLHRNVPEILHDVFKHDINFPYDLRIKDLLILPITNTQTYGTHSFAYRGSASWNSLPDIYKECTSESVLKNKLRHVKIICTCKVCL